MPISRHFQDCKALLVVSLTHVSGAIASVQTFTLNANKCSWNNELLKTVRFFEPPCIDNWLCCLQVVRLSVDHGKVLMRNSVEHQSSRLYTALSDLPWVTVMSCVRLDIGRLIVNVADRQHHHHFICSNKINTYRIQIQHKQGAHLSGKPGNVREFDNCQGNVGDFTKSQGKNLVREKLPKTVYCKLHICVHTGI